MSEKKKAKDQDSWEGSKLNAFYYLAELLQCCCAQFWEAQMWKWHYLILKPEIFLEFLNSDNVCTM